MSFRRYDLRIREAVNYGLAFVSDENPALAVPRISIAKIIRRQVPWNSSARTVFSANSKEGFRTTPGRWECFSDLLVEERVKKAGRIRGFRQWAGVDIEQWILDDLCLVCGALRKIYARPALGFELSFGGVCDGCAPKCTVCGAFNRPRKRAFDSQWPDSGRCESCEAAELLRCYKCSKVINFDVGIMGRPKLSDYILDTPRQEDEAWRKKPYCRQCRKSLFRSIVARERAYRQNAATIVEIRRMARENQKQRKSA